MKKLTILSTILFYYLQLFSQETTTELKAVKLIEQRKIELNGGLRSTFGGKSRTSIKVDLPLNTKEWYYSFTTVPGESGSQNLNLALQLSSLLIDPTGLSSAAVKQIKIPKGTSSTDIVLCDRANIDLFESKADLNGSAYHYFIEGSVQNTTEATVRINDITKGTLFIGLKNPSSLDAINVLIEVVAIVEETKVVEKTPEQQKAELYGSMGWKAYERGEYDKCLELSNEAINIYPELGWVHNNIGLVKLIKNDLIAAIESYGKAMTYFKKSKYSKQYFDNAIKDLEDLIKKRPDISGAKDMMETLRAERNRL